MKHIFSIAGTNILFEFENKFEVVTNSDKKLCRLSLVKKLPCGFVPLHGVLLKGKDFSVLITGAHGSGKTSLASQLTKMGFEILANDFVICWVRNNKILAGDLNYLSVNKSRKAVRVDYLVCLTPLDYRDRFIANSTEFAYFYKTTLKEMSPTQIRSVMKTLAFRSLYKIHFCLGNRQNIGRTTSSLTQVFERGHALSRIGIVGMGTIGQSLSNLLIGEKWIDELHLYTKTFRKLIGIEMDLKSAGQDTKIKIHKSLKNLVSNVDVLVLCFKVKNEGINCFAGERLQKVLPHAELIRKIANLLRTVTFKGRVLVVSNPVDLLSGAIYTFSNLSSGGRVDWRGLFSDQVFGVGLGLDYQRLNVLKSTPTPGLEVLGEHGDHLFLARRNGKYIKYYENKELLSAINSYSPNIREYVERTVFGPTNEIVRVLRVLKSHEGLLRVSTKMASENFAGNLVNCKNGFLVNNYLFDKDISNSFERYFLEVQKIKTLIFSQVLE